MITIFINHKTSRRLASCCATLQANKKVVAVVLQRCLGCLILCCLLLAGCAQQDEFESDQVGNFEALWTIMDEHYSFFDYKQVDWNEVHSRYRAMVSNKMTDRELFDVCGDMLKELRDGHTNLIATHDVSRYWIWEQWPVNYDERIIDQHYLNFDYKMSSGI